MRITLPPSLNRDLHPVAEEVAPYVEMTPEERLAIVAALSRDSIALLNLNPHRDEILTTRDEVPESTRRALRRLHAEFLEPGRQTR